MLGQPTIDYAVLGEGEQTFAELLASPNAAGGVYGLQSSPLKPLFDLDTVSSPYVEGILNVADERRMLLETVRGCRFRCKYCYYPKNHDVLRFLSTGQIAANLRHAAEHGATEVVLLDPTLNQRPDFADFLRLLAENNSRRQLAFSGELRAEGIDGETARLLHAANFHEVEIGLQSVEPRAWELMGRPTNLAAFERGVKAMLAEGIKVQVDMILGLPGDTVDSVRRGIDFLQRTQAYSEVQVFNLSILPGTRFRQEAGQLGLNYQPWPPYYVLETPTLDVEQIYRLMEESEEAFGIEFDPLPRPRLELIDRQTDPCRGCRIDLDALESEGMPCCPGTAASKPSRYTGAPAGCTKMPAVGFALWLRSADFHRKRKEAAALIDRLLTDNPHTTLQVILEPTAEPDRLTIETLNLLLATCYQSPTYLDRYYSLHPGRLLGSKRLFVRLPQELSADSVDDWRRRVANYATIL